MDSQKRRVYHMDLPIYLRDSASVHVTAAQGRHRPIGTEQRIRDNGAIY